MTVSQDQGEFSVTRYLIIALSVLFLSSFNGLTTSCQADEINPLVESAKKHILNKNFKELAALFLYPTSYSEEQIKNEIINISSGLSLLAHEFGEIDKLKLNQDKVQGFEFVVVGGDIDFLKKHPNFTEYLYRTNFSNIGPGFIKIHVYPNNGKPRLKGAGYALLATQENIPLANEIAAKYLALMQSRTPANNK